LDEHSIEVSLEFPETASLTQFDPDYLKAVLIAISGIAGQIITTFRHGIIPVQEARNKLLELF